MNTDFESSHFNIYFVLKFTKHAQSAIIISVKLVEEKSTIIIALRLLGCTLFVLKMQRNCPSIRLEVSDDGLNKQIKQEN